MTTTNFFWDEFSDNLLMETDENNVPTVVYTHRPERFGELISQKRGGVTSYYHYDGEHSTRLLTDDNQTVTDTYIYSAYGELVARTGTTTNPFGYKGAVGYYTNSATADIYVRARTYQPITGRWLSMDPLGFVDGPNLFQAYFVPGGIDPSGSIWVKCRCVASNGHASAAWDVEVDCIDLIESCCRAACKGNDFFSTILSGSGPTINCRFFIRFGPVGNETDRCGCQHTDIYSTCCGEVRTGRGGSTDPENVPTSPCRMREGEDQPLYVIGEGELIYGPKGVAGTPCRNATWQQIDACIRACPIRPYDATGTLYGDNCRTDVSNCAKSCCLVGF